ncbi:MAG: hypothetical protein JWL90_976 [Chthoniobacteraceae bacterium]|nr:hypothetical protein [Chthoniobacteraceae bacterium]
MNATESARFIGFKWVASFGEVNAADLLPAPPSKKSGKAQQLFSDLGTTHDIEPGTARESVIGILGRAARDQLAGTGAFHGGTTTKTALRKKLHSALSKIRKGAAVIAKTQGQPQLMADFVLPRKMNDTLLAAQVRAFAEAARPLLANFIELEHKADFIDSLLADVAAFEDVRDEQDASIQNRAGAGATIKTQIQRGLLIIEQLDVIMRNKYETRPEMLAAWHAASRIQHPAKSGKKAAPVVVPGAVIPLESVSVAAA